MQEGCVQLERGVTWSKEKAPCVCDVVMLPVVFSITNVRREVQFWM